MIDLLVRMLPPKVLGYLNLVIFTRMYCRSESVSSFRVSSVDPAVTSTDGAASRRWHTQITFRRLPNLEPNQQLSTAFST